MSAEASARKRGRPKKTTTVPELDAVMDIPEAPAKKTTRSASTKAAPKPAASKTVKAPVSTASAPTYKEKPKTAATKTTTTASKTVKAKPSATASSAASVPPPSSPSQTQSSVKPPSQSTPVTPSNSKILKEVAASKAASASTSASTSQSSPPASAKSQPSTPSTSSSTQAATSNVSTARPAPTPSSPPQPIPPKAAPKPTISVKDVNAFAVSQLSARPGHTGAGVESSRSIDPGKLPPQYKGAARRVTAIMVALPIAIVTSYELYQRVVLGRQTTPLSELMPTGVFANVEPAPSAQPATTQGNESKAPASESS